METPVEIDFQGLAPRQAIRDNIQLHIAELEKRFGRIIACRVVVKGPGEHHQTGGLYDINIHLAMPNAGDVAVGRTPQNDERFADIDFAIDNTFKRARRQLQDRVRKLQRQVKHHEPAPTGRVARLDPSGDFGFIEASDGREIYFHRNSVLNEAFPRLRLGTAVAFAEEEGEKGPQASTVRLVGKHLLP
jgi:cold shock CspA family protein